jgi:two-component system chemotaxis sensor kinase CheA
MSIDMEQFHEVFFEESLEGLDVMEQALLIIGQSNDPEVINTIFRAAHSIKGGSGTFGFGDVANFTHVLETLLDEARDGKRELNEECIELLLRSCDCLRGMFTALQAKETPNLYQSIELIAAFERILGATDKAVNTVQADAVTQTSPAGSGPMLSQNSKIDANTSSGTDNKATKHWQIKFVPEPQILLAGNEPLRLFREMAALGDLATSADISEVPNFADLTVDECFIRWDLELSNSSASKEDILEVFDWVIDECTLDIQLVGDNTSTQDNAMTSEPFEVPSVDIENMLTTNTEEPEQRFSAADKKAAPEIRAHRSDKNTHPSSSSSIRVGIDKVDSLINLVGELVITQSMLSELGNNFDMTKLERLFHGLEQLLQNTKELQESVMRIRMLPISFAFNRFPRMVRDVAIQIDKKVELVILGENTELDKTVMEKITDPLVHLVRNAIDHGIETPEERIRKGKPEQGCIRLDAHHQGGNVVIEVSDDGKGLNTLIIRNKAIEKGLIDSNEQLSDNEIYDLLFQPGFSTAAQVSDISGRGVGMDVVKRNIKSLGGRIVVQSKVDVGTTIKVHLPLTLAILDGQLVRVGQQVFIIPLITIVESLQVKPELVNRVSGDMVMYRLREDNVPIIYLYKEFDISADNTDIDNALLVVVESDGQKIGLLVDDLLAQQQVVIKSLESNYKRIEGISGATILGDGSVSMILDIPGLITASCRRSNVKRQFKVA